MCSSSGVTSNICGAVTAYREELMDYFDSEQWNLLEICCFSMYRGTQYVKGGGRYNSPTLVSRGLQEDL